MLKASYETNRYQLISNIFDDLIKSEYYPNSEKKVTVFSGLDYALSYTGNYSESLYLQRNILIPLSKYYNQKSRTDYVLLQQSANLYNLGKYQEAKEILEGLYSDPESTIPNSQLYNNLSLCYKQLGEKNEYTSFLLKAVQEAETSKNREQSEDFYKVKLGLYKNLFVHYNSIGDSTSALPFIRKAQNLAKLKNDDFELGSIHLYLGNYYLENFNDYEKAIEAYKKFLEDKFVEGMSWENYGNEWHIDHIVPLKYKNPTIEEVMGRLHYTNTQPLWVYDNVSKGNRYISELQQVAATQVS